MSSSFPAPGQRGQEAVADLLRVGARVSGEQVGEAADAGTDTLVAALDGAVDLEHQARVRAATSNRRHRRRPRLPLNARSSTTHR